MTSERRGRARAGAILLAGAALCLLVPVVHAQSSATLTFATPEVAPGAILVATFAVPAALPLDVAVQDHVLCALDTPAGSQTPCEWRGDPLSVRVVDGATEYVLALAAPALPGAYTLTTTRMPVADSQLLAASASAPFTVATPTAPDDPTNDPTDGPADEPLGTNGASGTTPRVPEDATRWFVSSSAATATALVLLVATTRPGGRP